LEENPDGAQNRRILRRGDPPQNPGDSAALKLLTVLERIPRLGILRLTTCTAGPRATRASQGLVVLELVSADHPLRSGCGFYLRVELALAEVLAKTVEELVTQVCDELSVGRTLISTLAPQGGPPPVEEALAN
jgi:hypothetical protein